MALGALISAGASLVSGLFGRSSAKKQAAEEKEAIAKANDKAEKMAAAMNAEQKLRAYDAALVPVETARESRSYVDMDQFMSDAEKYGFNPLTYLRSGALSMYQRTEDWSCVTGERAMDAALSGSYIPQLSPVTSSVRVPSTGEVFGNAIQSGANQWLQEMSQSQQNAFQKELLGMQLQGANRSGSAAQRSFYVPSAIMSGGDSATSNAVFGAKSGCTYLFGMCLQHDPSTSSGQDIEDRYGDSPASWLMQLGVVAADVAKSWPAMRQGVSDSFTQTRPPTGDELSQLLFGTSLDAVKADAYKYIVRDPWQYITDRWGNAPAPQGGTPYDPSKSVFQ